MSRDNILLVMGLIILVLFLAAWVPISMYEYKGVPYAYQAEIDQCESAIENYNDKLPDLINYERTNTDNNAFDNDYELERCRKIIDQPNHYIKGKYISFWIGTIIIGILLLALVEMIVLEITTVITE